MNLTRFRRVAVMLGVTGCLLLALSGTTAISVAADSVLYAKPSATGAGDCSDWDNACTLQTALGMAGTGDEIWVAAGTHKPTTGTDRTATFQLKSGVGVYGGFAGTETSRDQRDWTLHETILSGDIGTVGDDSDNSYHVVTGSGTDGTAVVDGFRIRGGNADGSSPHHAGGGMYNDNGSPTLANLDFSGNYASVGGGMYNRVSSPTLTKVTFSGNYATAGGGMYNRVSSPTLTKVTFSGNSADEGGGMWNWWDSDPTLTNVTFSGNSASHIGGGMYNGYSGPNLSDVTFGGNEAGAACGGMYDTGGDATLTNVTFIGNSSDTGGGMCNDNGSKPTLTNVIFSGNSVGWNGGGMYNEESSPTLTNVIFSGNSADYRGGAMDSVMSSTTLINVTLTGNSADSYGGGMYNTVSSPTLANCILWGNSAPDGPQVYNATGTPAIGYSLVEGSGGSGPFWDTSLGTDGGGNIDAHPRFIDANGFDNTVGTLDDNLRLQLTSPAIDAGDNGAVPSGITFDLDGNPRFVDVPTVPDTGLGTPPIVDMGAYEAQPLPSPPPVPPAPEAPPRRPAPAAPTDPVPEWGSIALLSSGLAGMAGYAGLRMRRWKR